VYLLFIRELHTVDSSVESDSTLLSVVNNLLSAVEFAGVKFLTDVSQNDECRCWMKNSSHNDLTVRR